MIRTRRLGRTGIEVSAFCLGYDGSKLSQGAACRSRQRVSLGVDEDVGGDHVFALFDRLPAHTIMALTLTVRPQDLGVVAEHRDLLASPCRARRGWPAPGQRCRPRRQPVRSTTLELGVMRHARREVWDGGG